MKSVSVKFNTIVRIIVAVCGEWDWDGVTFEYYPELPDIVSKHIQFNGISDDCDFLRLTLNDKDGVDCWFTDNNNEEAFFLSLDAIKSNQLLYRSIALHIYNKMNKLIEENA